MTLTDVEIRAINTMRRGPTASVLRAVAERAAAEALARYESTPASEENRLAAAAASDVIVVLFKKEL